MRRRLNRPLVLGVSAVLVVAAATSAAALAASGQGPARVFRGGFALPRPGTFGLGGGPGFGGFGGPGFAFGKGGGVPLGPGFGAGMGPGGPAGVLGADILDPAATYLGISATKLESDLAGGKTLSAEVTAVGGGKTTSGLISAIVAAEKSVLDGDVAAGWLTSAQESALVTGYTDAVTALVNNGPPIPRPARQAVGLLQTAATFLGISVSTLQSDLSSGKTLAQVTTGAGKQVSDLITALEAPAKTKLDAAVSAGTITPAQETTILNNLTTRLTAIVNRTDGSRSTNAVEKNLVRLATLERSVK